MSDWQIRDTETGQTWAKDSRAECESAIEEFSDMDLEIVEPDTDGGTKVVETVEEPAESTELPERNIRDDPFEWMPGHYIDTIEGDPAINRKGFAVLSQFYDISVVSDVIVGPEETDFEYCRCEATAKDAEGNEYRAHGSAHVDRGDDKELLLEMADTRATKRVLAIATGVGAVAVEELKGEL